MRIIARIVAGSIILAGQFAQADPPNSEEMEIYKVLLRQAPPIVLQKAEPTPKDSASAFEPDTSQVKDFITYLRKTFPTADPEMIANYAQHPPSPAEITSKTDLGVKLTFIDSKTMGDIFKSGQQDLNAEWSEFKRRYPEGGFGYLTRAVFNAKKTQALLFMETSFGPTGMDGDTVFLEKRDGKWVEAGREEDVAS